MPHSLLVMPDRSLAVEPHVPDGATKLLDHGFLRLVDSMGDDERIVYCARRSYQDGTEHLRSTRGLIRYLLRNKHSSPFEHVCFTFHAFLPMFVFNQWVRHRIASYSVLSKRYSKGPGKFYLPMELRRQHDTNKQMSAGTFEGPANQAMRNDILAAYGQVEAVYQALLEAGVCRELARVVLPEGIYTDMVVTMNLGSAMNFIRLRWHPHAQPEIQVFAKGMYDLVRPIVPDTLDAFEDFVRNARTISHKEDKVFMRLCNTLPRETLGNLAEAEGMSSPEIRELVARVCAAC